MMYDRMIEEYEQKQSEYRATLDAVSYTHLRAHET